MNEDLSVEMLAREFKINYNELRKIWSYIYIEWRVEYKGNPAWRCLGKSEKAQRKFKEEAYNGGHRGYKKGEGISMIIDPKRYIMVE